MVLRCHHPNKKVDQSTNQQMMEIDIGLRQLAVASVINEQNKETKRAFHNGKQAGFIRKNIVL